jgi:hypothetical protein
VLAGLLSVVALAATACQGNASVDRSSGVNAVAPEASSPLDGQAGELATPGAKDSATARQETPSVQRQVVRTANLSLRVDVFTQASGRVRDLAGSVGGHVEQESLTTDSGSLTLRVPAEKLDTVLERLAEVGSIEHRGIQTQDVTEQFVDVDARIAAQRASVARVRALLDRAGDITEIVRVEQELTRRQADLDSLVRRRDTLAGQTALSTVNVSLAAKSASPPVAQEGFVGGLTAGWRALVNAVRILLVVFGAALPFLVAIGVPVALLVIFLRRWVSARPPVPVGPARPVSAAPPLSTAPPPPPDAGSHG